jgi:hypothetical protein
VCGLLFAAQLPADDGQHRSHLNLGWQLSRRLKVEQRSIRLFGNSLAGGGGGADNSKTARTRVRGKKHELHKPLQQLLCVHLWFAWPL